MPKVLAVIILILMPVFTYAESQAEKYNYKVTQHHPNETFKGITLYSITGKAKVLLLDIDGTILNDWDVDAVRPRLLPNCNLLAVHGTDWGKKNEPWKSLRKTVREYDWNGKIIWEYTAEHAAHHDINRLENGNTIFPLKTTITKTVHDKNGKPDPVPRRIRSDIILEVDKLGNKVWEWALHDYLDVMSCGSRPCKVPLNHEKWKNVRRDWSHVNTTSLIPPNKWFSKGDRRFRPGNIMFLPKNMSQVFIISRKSNQIIWEYSGDYKGGLMFSHESYMIEEGYPGAGNILIFDNGGKKRKQTIILEVNPTTKEVVWAYEKGDDFYVEAKGASQRLANGNTLISTGAQGSVLEVTPDGTLVWELSGKHPVNRAKRYSNNYCDWNKKL